MKIKIVILMLVLLVVSLSSAYAGNTNRIGTAGGQVLLIPIGSRGTAMGGAIIADVTGVESMYWNPAGLSYLQGTEFMFSHLPYWGDMDVNFGGIATNIESFGAIGFSAKLMSIGDIEETTDALVEGTGRVFSPSLTVLGITYARQMTANVAFGVTAQLLNENIFEVSASGVSFDVGFSYDPRWHNVRLGLVVKNYGPGIRFSGKGFETDVNGHKLRGQSEKIDLPSYASAGISYGFLKSGLNSATMSVNYRSNNFSADMWQGGFEYNYNDRYFLRGGYNYSNQNSYLYGASLGAGLVFPIGGSKFTIEYSWNQTDTFEDNQFFTIKANF